MLELYTQKDMGEEKSKSWLDRSLMSPSYHAEHIMLRYMDASTMQKLNTHHWRLSANQPPYGISPSSGMLTAPSSLSVCTLSTSGSFTFSLRMR